MAEKSSDKTWKWLTSPASVSGEALSSALMDLVLTSFLDEVFSAPHPRWNCTLQLLPHIPRTAWILLSLEEKSNMRVQNLCNFYMNMSSYKEDWMLYWWLGSNLNTLVFWIFVFFLAFLVASRMEVYIGKEPRNVSALPSSDCTWQSSQEIPM